MDRKAIKEQAKTILKGKVSECAKLVLIFLGINLLAGFVLGFIAGLFKLNKDLTDLLSSVISLVISGMLGFGMTNFFLKMSRGENVTYKELFAKKDLMLPYIIISLLTGIFVFLWSLLFIIPGIIAAISYSFAYLIFLDNPNMKPAETLKVSKQMLEGHKKDLFVLNISFIGWIILGIFTLGILYIWLIPYMSISQCIFYNQLKNSKN